jgi:hypothetical protein
MLEGFDGDRFTPSTAVVTDCQAHREVVDEPSASVVKAASNVKLTLAEVEMLGDGISKPVDAWRSKILRKFGSSSARPPWTNHNDKVQILANIAKIDEEQHQVFGFASVSEIRNQIVKDHQGDELEEVELEKAAYDLMLSIAQEPDAVAGNVMHDDDQGVFKLIELMVFTKDKQAVLKIDVPVGLWVGYQITDPAIWKQVKDGQLKMFSIEGEAERVPVAA